ncbi:hypothetical protein KFE25_002945 [Diacronema lutheri]|uniref:Uncharacterized protein n=1 Tax=Diacronema lutheri TaxID=2081491 RepID=A0A8J6CFH4_DIALT|nr:hypothetical protein KFE25_002945 [Diacronema lutheri]
MAAALVAACYLAHISPPIPRSSILSQPVFIEDTDAYSVVYHNNFITKYVHRALQRHCAVDGRSAAPVDLLAVDETRFLRPATLGDVVRIQTTVVHAAARGILVADHSLACMRGDGEFVRARSFFRLRAAACADGGGDEAALGEPRVALPTWYDLGAAPAGHAGAFAYDLDVWQDELGTTGGLSAGAVLRAFERARTASLGGPAVLSRLHAERIKCLVARIDELAFNVCPARGLPSVRLGERGLCVRTTAEVRKARITFEQRLVCSRAAPAGAAPADQPDAETATRRVTDAVLARGLVTCLCVDAESGRMSSPPEWLASRYLLPAQK